MTTADHDRSLSASSKTSAGRNGAEAAALRSRATRYKRLNEDVEQGALRMQEPRLAMTTSRLPAVAEQAVWVR
ncbi:MAG: hypothetical protein ACJAUC_002470 [Planctomycetota bacterium]|jgi:hypothetical protein